MTSMISSNAHNVERKVLKTFRDQIDEANREFAEAIINRLQTEVVQPLAKYAFTDNAYSTVQEMVEKVNNIKKSVQKTFGSVVDVMNESGRDYVRRGGGMWSNVPQIKNLSKLLDKAGMKKPNAQDHYGIDDYKAVAAAANALNSISRSVALAMHKAKNAGNKSGFGNSGVVSSLQKSVNTITKDIDDVVAGFAKSARQVINDMNNAEKTASSNTKTRTTITKSSV